MGLGMGRKPQGFTWEDLNERPERFGKKFPNRSIGVPFQPPAFPYVHSELSDVTHPKLMGVNLANWQTGQAGNAFLSNPILLRVGQRLGTTQLETKRYLVTIRILATSLFVTAGLLFSVSTAYAKKPLDVDCDLLEATNDAVNDFLDMEGIQFNNLGDLVSSSIQDEVLFEQLRDLILLFSGGEIGFTSASQAVSTNAKCGLIPQLIDNIRD